MADKQENLGKFPRSPYEIGVEVGRTATIVDEREYTTTDGQSTFPIREVDFDTFEEEDDKLLRNPGFIRGFDKSIREQLTTEEEQ